MLAGVPMNLYRATTSARVCCSFRPLSWGLLPLPLLLLLLLLPPGLLRPRGLNLLLVA